MDMPVPYFVFSTTRIYLLFQPWYISAAWQYAIAVVGLILATLAFEWLKALQHRLTKLEHEAKLREEETEGARRLLLHSKAAEQDYVSGEANRDLAAGAPSSVPICSRAHPLRVSRSLVHGAQVAISYLLMVVVMTFNAGFLLAIVGAACVGHYLFSRPASTPPESSSLPCH